jgi:hypothetical protein
LASAFRAARIAFWNTVKPRLDRLSNRLDPKAMRMAIHARIPWPKQDERDMAEARREFARSHAAYQAFVGGPIARNEKMIERLAAENAELREKGAPLADDLTRATERFSRLMR